MSDQDDKIRGALRAEPVHLWALRAACCGWGPVAVTTTADCMGEPERPDVEDWCVYDPSEDDPPLASGMSRTFADTVAHAINEAPALVEALMRTRRLLGEALSTMKQADHRSLTLKAIQIEQRLAEPLTS